MILIGWKRLLMSLLLPGLILALSPDFAAGQTVVKTQVIGAEGLGSHLGIEMEDVTAGNMAAHKLAVERGVIIARVEKGSPAEKAGLLEKDVILEFAGTPVQSTAQFARMVRETPPGRKVDLVVSRDGKKLNLAAETGKREGPPRVIVGGRMGEPDQEFEFEGPRGRSFSFRLPRDGRQDEFFGWHGDGPGLLVEGRPRLGVTLEPLTDQMGEFLGVPGKKGALVTTVVEGTPAAGRLKAGDVIVRADDRAVSGPEDLQSALRNKEESASVSLKIIRNKKEIPISIELAKTERKTGGFRM